ncbi:MAG: thioredoxin-disulfide reductase [Kiritimatiellia bacterium]
MEKVVIAGSGPAGLTAALYTARANLNPLVLLGPVPGGQLVVSYEVENYPGFVEPISGAELMDRFRDQAARFGARLEYDSIHRARKSEQGLVLETDRGAIETQTLVVATGAEARRLPIPSEPAFYGKGVSGCATCDGAFFRDQEVLVVGGGNTAMEDAMFLTRFASKVTLVHRRSYFRAAQIEVDKCRRNPKIAWLVPWVIEEILGENGGVTGAILRQVETGETQQVSCQGIFVAIGHDPKTEPFKGLVEMDSEGFIVADAGSTRTSMPGVFACGDVRDPRYKQAVLAAGHGCMAALDVEQYLGQRE